MATLSIQTTSSSRPAPPMTAPRPRPPQQRSTWHCSSADRTRPGATSRSSSSPSLLAAGYGYGYGYGNGGGGGGGLIRPVTPPELSRRLLESIETAKEACAGDMARSGACAVAWDVVEELSAAASHWRERERMWAADPLEAFCRANPGAGECRAYDA